MGQTRLGDSPRKVVRRLQSEAALLDEIRDAITDYVDFRNQEQATAVTLWVAATHALRRLDFAPRLVITSPEKRCGKTRLMEILVELVRDGQLSSNISEAALFRLLDGVKPPTIFIDEADTMFGSRQAAQRNEALRGVLNAGFSRSGQVHRVEGHEREVKAFRVFGMVCLGGIGAMPDTIEDRAIVVRLQRKKEANSVRPYRLTRDRLRLIELRERLAARIEAVIDTLDADPPTHLSDRAADVWSPLFAVADAVGGRWSDEARDAAAVMLQEHDRESPQRPGLDLLAALSVAVQDRPGAFVGSEELVFAINSLPADVRPVPKLTTRALALTLRRFQVAPTTNSKKTIRGYKVAEIRDAAVRYGSASMPSKASKCPQPPNSAAKSPSGGSPQSVRASVRDDDSSAYGKKRVRPAKRVRS